MRETSDRIFVRDLSARCIIGIFPDEREKMQELLINLVLYCDLSGPGQSDQIEDTVNYKEIKQRVLALVEKSEFFLIERVAAKVAELCLEHKGVNAVEVTVDKPGALRFAASVAVSIYRERAGG